MSQESVEIVRRAAQNLSLFGSLLDEYVVFDMRESPLLDLDDAYVGRDAVIEASRHYWGTWDGYSVEVDELIDAGSSSRWRSSIPTDRPDRRSVTPRSHWAPVPKRPVIARKLWTSQRPGREALLPP
jgi:hypothetical protein